MVLAEVRSKTHQRCLRCLDIRYGRDNMVRFGYRKLRNMTDDSLATICNAGVWKGKRVDHVTKKHACSVLNFREKSR